jgi:hypothetical protein
MSSTTAEGAEQIMTDYQFRAIVKMILDIVKRAQTVEEIQKSLEAIISDEKEKSQRGEPDD